MSVIRWVVGTCVALACLACHAAQPDKSSNAVSGRQHPNILWITSEDNGSQWLGCYGNRQAQTPRLDALARSGLKFTRAYSNAAVCAVARSTLLTGAYAVRLGTQHMRSRYPVDERFRPYVEHLRQQGYYCCNNSKTDFNIRGDDKAIWDACSNKAHFRNRRPDQPFFAVFNLTVSHESSLFPATVRRNRSQHVIPEQPRISPEAIDLPPYLPDLPEIRNDFAIYHDVMTAMDRQVGELLDELDRAGLADDTIVFYFSDHGGPTPRGKRYLEDTGVRVPLLIRIPEKFRSLSPFAAGTDVDELVSFVDFAPTLLSITGVEPPTQMQGRAFLGSFRQEPRDGMVFLFADRFDEIVGMRRGITDGRFKYIRYFMPHLPAAPYSYYPLSMPGWRAWQAAAAAGALSGYHAELWKTPQRVEHLFDLRSDPWEIHNLAGDADSQPVLQKMQSQLKSKMIAVGDSGVIPEGMFIALAQGRPISKWVDEHPSEFNQLVETAFQVTSADADRVAAISTALGSARPEMRYWGLRGCLTLGASPAELESLVRGALDDAEPTNRIVAADGIFHFGDPQTARKILAREIERPMDTASFQLLLNTISDLQLEEIVPEHWIEETLANPKADPYHRRFAERVKQQRKAD